MQPDYQAIRWDTLQLDILLHRKPVVRSRLDGADSGAAVAPVVPDAPKTAICSGLPVPRGRAHPLSDWEQDETIYGEQISSQCR